ncbi:MAG TPA: sugar phosphate isomerase/epimerase [Ohtaekwangia sp.]|nr:sugar phosphate isomerase/epimerase [Ohtaekwangia sp.]
MIKRLLLLCLITAFCSDLFSQRIELPEIGVVQSLEHDSLLHAQGYSYLVESTSRLLSPAQVSEEQFKQRLGEIKNSQIPVFACNLFIPGDLKVVGPAVNENAVLEYVKVVFQRAEAAGVKMIIWGSGGSRRIPDGFDHWKAKTQFISIAKKVADEARKHSIVLALENLNTTEVNFINSLAEGYDIAKAVDHPNFGLCADIYHMLKEDESPAIIVKAKSYVIYCEVAEEEERTAPGIHGENFKPYFEALKKIGYKGKIGIECRWRNVAQEGAPAYQYLKKQLEEVYDTKGSR